MLDRSAPAAPDLVEVLAAALREVEERRAAERIERRRRLAVVHGDKRKGEAA